KYLFPKCSFCVIVVLRKCPSAQNAPFRAKCPSDGNAPLPPPLCLRILANAPPTEMALSHPCPCLWIATPLPTRYPLPPLSKSTNFGKMPLSHPLPCLRVCKMPLHPK